MTNLHPIMAEALAPFAPREQARRSTRYAATEYTAFRVSAPAKLAWNPTGPTQRTSVIGLVDAATIDEAVAAAIEASAFAHKEQLVIRETGPRGILLHIYAIVKKPDVWVYRDYVQVREQRFGTKLVCLLDGGVVGASVDQMKARR